MPIYEFYCPNNHKIYSFFARSLAYSNRVPRCPDNPKFQLEKAVSAFAITGKAKEENEDFPLDMDESKLESALGSLERELGGMDTENPDPRQLAQFMKRFTDVTGQKMPEIFNEMMARMEKGEDPEALEAEYGDALDDDALLGSLKKTLASAKKPPVRDPELYEFSDYID